MPERYNQPSKGADNWNVPLNENFAALDIHVEHRGPDDDKSDVTHAEGVKYFATDTGTIYISDGSSWTEVGTVNGVTSPDITRIFARDTDPEDDGFTVGEDDLWIDTSE